MKIKHIILLAGIITLSFNSAKAQTATPPSATAIKAAEEMLIASGASAQFDKSITTILGQYSGQIPEDKRAAFTKVMTTFLNKYCSWETLKPDMCTMYAREFSEAELKELTAFYKTPLGIKLNQKQPILMQTAMNIGQQSVINHQSELQQLMVEVMK